MRGKGTTTRLKQPERAQAPPHGEQSSAFRETNHSIDASSWIFTSQHDSLVKGLHKSAPPDLQVWARRRRQAARKAQIPTKKPVTRTRSPLLRPPPRAPPPLPVVEPTEWQVEASDGRMLDTSRPGPIGRRRATGPLNVSSARIPLQHALIQVAPSHLKHPLRSSRNRVLMRELQLQQKAAQRQLHLSEMLRE